MAQSPDVYNILMGFVESQSQTPLLLILKAGVGWALWGAMAWDCLSCGEHIPGRPWEEDSWILDEKGKTNLGYIGPFVCRKSCFEIARL